jgi:conjugal transfer mating pair stabilization protein TraG
MESVIYTFGGGEALWKVFNGIAIIFSSGSGYMTSIMKLSMAIGGLWAAFRAILGANMGIFGKDYFVPTYLILNLLLIPTTSVHIIDEVNPGFKYSKVDHVPVGIAVIASTASQISKLVTNTIEGAFTAVDANQYGKTGPMFAARLVAMSRHMTVSDPIMRQNLKDFVRQCFTLPLVWTNMLAGKKAALETTDILGLIESNPHSWLGSYWRKEGGDSAFLYCKEGVAKAKEVMKLEVPNSLVGLATNLFGDNNVDAMAANKRLKTYFDDAWVTLAKNTSSAHEVAGQQMMMNIYRESGDDKREEFGLARRNPELVALSSARAKYQQNAGFLVGAQMVGSMLPSLQSTMLAILCILFVVIVPMTILPGGLKTLGMWVKLIIWVESWPIFFAIVNCISLIMASGRGAALVSTGAGLSLLTQNDLADAAWDAYCYAESFMAIVPVIAWAVISQSGYALANLAGTITRSVNGLSSKIGAETTDGNLSFDNQSFNNRSIAGYQLAQQQLGSSFGFSEKFDDGSKLVTWDTKGSPNIQETLTNLGTHTAVTDNVAATLRESGEKALSASNQNSVMASNSFSQGLQELQSFTDQFSKGSGVSDGFGSNANSTLAEDLKLIKGFTDKYGQDHTMSDGKSVKLGGQGGFSFGKKGVANIGGDLSGHINADDSEKISKVLSSDEGKNFSEALGRIMQYSKDHKGSLTDQSQIQSLESIQGSFQDAKQYSYQAQASLIESENYRNTADYMESKGAAITTNLDKQILKDIADKSFNGDELQAYSWYTQNPEAYQKHAAEFARPKIQPFMDELRMSHPMSEDQIRSAANKHFANTPNTIDRSDIDSTKGIADRHDVGEKSRQKMENDVSTLRGNTDKAFQNHGQQIETGKNNVNRGHQDMEKTYKERGDHGVSYWAGKRAMKETYQTAKDIGEGVKDIGGWLVDKIKPDTIPSMENSAPAGSNTPSITVAKLALTEASSSVSSSVRDNSSRKTTSFTGGESPQAPSFRETGFSSEKGQQDASRETPAGSQPSSTGSTYEKQAAKEPSVTGNSRNEFRSSPVDKGLSEPSFTRDPSIDSNRSTGSSTTSFRTPETRPQSAPSSVSSPETSSFREATSNPQGDMQPATYVRSMEDSIEQGRATHKMASQGRQIKQLKDSIEINKASLQEEAPLDRATSQKVES